jgi:hypothetical protein
VPSKSLDHQLLSGSVENFENFERELSKIEARASIHKKLVCNS